MQYTSDADIAKQVIYVPEMFGFLIDRYEKKMYTYVRRITNVDGDVAHDVVQDVFIKAYENIASYDEQYPFNSWIYKICHNTAINTWKKDKRNSSEHSLELDEKLLHELQGQLPDAMYLADQDILSHDFNRILSLLKPRYREVLILRFYEDLSYDEIGEVLMLPPGTVATQISRAKKQFAQLLVTHTKHDRH